MYELHERLHLDTLATRRAKTMVKLVYGCIHNQQPAYLYDQLIPTTHGNWITRAVSAGILEIPKSKSRYSQYSFSFRGPLQWNLTKVELKAAVNIVQLKNLLKSSW